MDERRFDALTKALVAAKPSRREALRRLAGGTLATVFGGLALEEASAQFGTQAFNLTCRGDNPPETYCKGGRPGDCGREADGCVCAQEKRGKAVCVEQPVDDCPTRNEACRRTSDCGSGELCIRVSACDCRHSGMCARECPA
jgi:hypothetical protein